MKKATKPAANRQVAKTTSKPAAERQVAKNATKIASKAPPKFERFILTKRNCDIMSFELYSTRGGNGYFGILPSVARKMSPFPKAPRRGMYPLLKLQIRYGKGYEESTHQGTIVDGAFIRWISAAEARAIKAK